MSQAKKKIKEISDLPYYKEEYGRSARGHGHHTTSRSCWTP